MGVENLKKYTYSFLFGSEVEITEKMESGLIDGESVVAAYRTDDTLGLFTTKRILYKGRLFDQRTPLFGEELNIFTIPYSSIDIFSSEFSDTTLFNAFRHLNIWTKGGQEISILFNKHVNMKKVRQALAQGIL